MKRHASLLAICALLAVYAAAQNKSATTPSPNIPAGTQLQVRIIENLSSADAKPGQVFHGTLAEPIMVNGRTLYAKGADVTGHVTDAKPSGRLSDSGTLVLTLTSISDATHKTNITTDPFEINGESHTKSNVTKIGGGAAAGAVIGAIAGGGKGAAIGAAVGAAAGTGVAAATGKKEASVESEAVLGWNVAGSSPVTAAAITQSAAQRSPVREFTETAAAPTAFATGDKRAIRACFTEHEGDLPPGLAKRESLPPGIQRQLQRGGTLPPGLQKRVSPMPEVCERELSPLPPGYQRVVYGNRAMLIDGNSKIVDAFELDTE